MNRRKKVVLICSAAAAFVAAASFGITLAYLGDTTGKDNTVIVGHGDEEISEEFNAPSEVSISNNEVKKKFSITNTGTVPLFARLYAEFSDSTIADKAKVKVGNKEYKWAEFKTKMALPPENRGTDNDILPKNWRYMREISANGKLGGYFYYTEVLNTNPSVPVGKPAYNKPNVTDRLFDSVVYSYSDDPTNESNIDLISGFEMIVYSETVQTVETGSVEVSKVDEHSQPVLDENNQPVMETVYGYDYAEKNEWLEAWKSYLRVSP